MLSIIRDTCFERQSDECVELINYTQPQPDKANGYFGLILGIVAFIYYYGFLALYALRRQSSQYLKQRLFGFVVITTVGFSYENIWALREYFGRENLPCILSAPSVYLTFALTVIPLVLRVFHFYRRIAYAKYISKDKFLLAIKRAQLGDTAFAIIAAQDKKLDVSTSKAASSRADASSAKGSALGTVMPLSTISDAQKPTKNPDLVGAKAQVLALASSSVDMTSSFKNDLRGVTSEAQDQSEFEIKMKQKSLERKNFSNAEDPQGIKSDAGTDLSSVKERYRKFIYTLSTVKFIWGLYGVFCVFLFIPIWISIAPVYDCCGCEDFEARDSETAFSAITLVIVIILVLIAFYKIRNEPDPFYIKRELAWIFICAFFFVAFYVPLTNIDPGDLYLTGKMYWGYFLIFAYLACFTIMVPMQIYFAHKSDLFMKNAQFEITEDTFEKDMESEILKQQFKKYLVREQALENYFFWAEATQWKRDFKAIGENERRKRFMFIFTTFLTDNEYLEINISGDLKGKYREIARKILFNEDVTLNENTFEEAYIEVRGLLVNGPYFRFKSKVIQSSNVDDDNKSEVGPTAGVSL